MSTNLLVVEDDTDLLGVLSEFLKSEGFIVYTASSGSKALKKVDETLPDLVLLDLGLPDIQGESVLLKIREKHPNLPVIILTAKSKPQDIAQGLNIGADDYLPKPFAAEELLARINARIKKVDNTKDMLCVQDLTLDLSRMIAIRKGVEITLTKTEYDLLRYLMENAGRVITREMILNHVWGYTTAVESRVVDVYIGYLRKKIDGTLKKKLIINNRGFGYLIDNQHESKK
jgi:DNA-binding response OmpR family regulator